MRQCNNMILLHLYNDNDVVMELVNKISIRTLLIHC